MAFDAKPSTWIPNWSEDATNITVPIATFPEMTAAEADATTGDIRKVLFAICEQLFQAWNDTATADRPNQLNIGKSISENVSTGVRTNTYTFRFYTGISGEEVNAET